MGEQFLKYRKYTFKLIFFATFLRSVTKLKKNLLLFNTVKIKQLALE